MMSIKREVIQLKTFAKKVDNLIKLHKLDIDSFEIFKRVIAENPEMGDMIPGTGGIRKTRLGSTSKGKSGGFRVCYYFHNVKGGKIYLVTLYPKNEKVDLTSGEKQELKAIAEKIKNR